MNLLDRSISDQTCSHDDCRTVRGSIQEVGRPLASPGCGSRKAARLLLPHVVCESRPARCSRSGELSAGPDAVIVIRAGVSAKVQSLGSVNIVRGTLDDIGRIGLRWIRPIPGAAGDKRSDGEGKPDQANASSKRSSSGHRRVFLDRIGPVSRNEHRFVSEEPCFWIEDSCPCRMTVASGNVMSCQWVADNELADVLGGCGTGLVSGNSGRKSSSFPMTPQAGNPAVIDSSPGMSKADRKAVSACSEGPLAALPAGRIILLGGALG